MMRIAAGIRAGAEFSAIAVSAELVRRGVQDHPGVLIVQPQAQL